MELIEIESKLKVIKWFTAFSIYCSKDHYFEIKAYRNRRGTIQSGLHFNLEDTIKATIEKAEAHDLKVSNQMRLKK